VRGQQSSARKTVAVWHVAFFRIKADELTGFDMGRLIRGAV
jgi:hypothetical protein